MEKLIDRWNSASPKDKLLAKVGLVMGGSVTAMSIGSVALVLLLGAREHRGDYVPLVYPRVQVENDSFRLARLAKDAARITLFREPETEEQKDILWGDVLKSLQKETPIRCSWVLERIYEDPSSFLAQCVFSYP